MQTNCTITISGNRAYFEGLYSLEIVRKVSSFPVKGAHFSKAFKKGLWDGRKHLFDKKSLSMPSGLVPAVVKALKAQEGTHKIAVVDRREDNVPSVGANGYSLDSVSFGEYPYDYQPDVADVMIKAKRGIIKIATNGTKTAIAIAVIKHLSVPSVFIVPGIDLLRQTRKRFTEYLGLSEDEIGYIGEGEYRVGAWVTVATMDSLHAWMERDYQEFKSIAKRWDVLVMDECHSVGSETHYEVADAIPAYYRFGLSGTPLDRSDGADLKLIAQTGEIVYEISNKFLIERGISVRPHIEMIRIDKPEIHPKMTWQTVQKVGIIDNEHLNKKVVEKVVEFTDQNLGTVVMVEKYKHADNIRELLDKEKVRYKYLSGKEKGPVREEALNEFTNKELDCLLVTTVFDQGIDTPAIDALIFAAGGKAVIRSLQRIGRGVRNGEGKDKLIVVDFVHLTHKYLAKHSLKRLGTYKREDCFVISQSA